MKHIVAKRIKELMNEENVNQTQLGKAIGIEYRTVSSWVHGKTEPHIDDLWLLADYFDVDVDFLIGRKDF